MDRLLRAIERIETRLEDPLTLADAAEAAGLSSYHFCRYFRAMTGDSIMGYIRARRLSLTVPRLVEGTDRLIDIALDSGFESQEAYTRAFKKRFGVTPGAVRRGEARIDPVLLKPTHSKIWLQARQEMIDVTPSFKTLESFQVTGLSQTVSKTESEAIPGMWDSLYRRISEIKGLADQNGYGVCVHPKGAAPDTFDYIAGKKVDGTGPTPEGMVTVTLPEQLYAVFSFQPQTRDLGLEFRKVYTFIFEKWLPDSGYRMADASDFEFYENGRFNPMTLGGEIDIFFPVEKR